MARLERLLSTSRSAIHESVATLSGTKGLAGIFNNTMTLGRGMATCRPAMTRGSRLGGRRGRGVTGCTTDLVAPSSFICLSTKAAANLVLRCLTNMETTFIAGTMSRTRALTGVKVQICLVKKRLGDSARTIMNDRTVRVVRVCRFAGKFFKAGKVAEERNFAAPSADRTVMGDATVGRYGSMCVLASGSGFNRMDSIAFNKFASTGVLARRVPRRCRSDGGVLGIGWVVSDVPPTSETNEGSVGVKRV